MDFPPVPNMAEISTLSITSVIKNETEDTSSSDTKTTLGDSNFTHNQQNQPVSMSPMVSNLLFKLESKELDSNDEETEDTSSSDTKTVIGDSNFKHNQQNQLMSMSPIVSNLLFKLESKEVDSNDKETENTSSSDTKTIVEDSNFTHNQHNQPVSMSPMVSNLLLKLESKELDSNDEEGHFSPTLFELNSHGNIPLVVSSNWSASGCSNSSDLYSKAASLNKKKKHLSVWLPCEKSRNNYECNICKRKFQVKSKLNIHERKHTGEKPFKCDICEKRFSLAGNLRRHERVHTGEKPFKCDICEEKFSQAVTLRVHQRVHTGEKPFKCDICEKRFSRAGTLRLHQRVHTGEKPFKCDICEKRFSRADALRLHQRVHTGEKPFKCDICEKRFSLVGDLRMHQRVHTGEKPFKCDQCERRFSQANNLRLHQRVHTGVKPFDCDVCKRSFYYKQNLKYHLKKHLKEKPTAPINQKSLKLPISLC